MAKSRARKIREQRVRQGKLNPSATRGTHAGLYERKTKTKQETLVHQFHKYKRDLRQNEYEGPFYMVS